jgi:hypothetical protein
LLFLFVFNLFNFLLVFILFVNLFNLNYLVDTNLINLDINILYLISPVIIPNFQMQALIGNLLGDGTLQIRHVNGVIKGNAYFKLHYSKLE